MFGMLKIYWQTVIEHVFANITSPKSRVALQFARKIAPCARAFNFTGESVRFNDETLRFKREQTREIVHASCLNVDGSIYIQNKKQILEISS